MSFVSVAGNKKFINIMCDGRAVYADGTIEDDWQKFIIFNNKRFIAFAGTVHCCRAVVDVAEEYLDLQYEKWIDKVKAATIDIPYSKKTGKAVICIGGKDSNLKFSSFSNKPGQEVHDYELIDDNISYALLSNMDDDEILDGKFMEFAQRYRSIKSRDILLAQRDLNNYVADLNPETVNKNTSSYVLKFN